MTQDSHRWTELRLHWRVLIAAAVGTAGGLAVVPIYSLSSFIRPLGETFGWAPGAVGVAGTILTAGMFLTSPPLGRLSDRWGARRIVLPSIVLMALAFAALALIGPSILSLYLGYAVLALAGSGTTAVLYTRVVAGWFERSRGLALGVTMMGTGLTAALLPLLLAQTIGQGGWRAGFLTCAVATLIPLAPVWLFLKEKGKLTTAASSSAQISEPRLPPAARDDTPPGASLGQALRDRRFWAMAVSALVLSSAVGGVVIHILPILAQTGLTPGAAARTAAWLGLGIIVGRAGTGPLLDLFPGPWVAAGLMATTCVGFALLLGGVAPLAPVAVLLVGLSLGSESDLMAYFTSRYFGMRSYAELFGWLFAFMALGVASGPLLIVAFQSLGGYKAALTAFIVQGAVAGVLLGTLGPYPKAGEGLWPQR